MQTSGSLINRLRALQKKVAAPGYVVTKDALDEAIQIATHALRLLVRVELICDNLSIAVTKLLKSMNLTLE